MANAPIAGRIIENGEIISAEGPQLILKAVNAAEPIVIFFEGDPPLILEKRGSVEFTIAPVTQEPGE